jgi:TetR/AcrR family transcriptional repressor of nem operon
MKIQSDTAEHILNVAERYIQIEGVNAFSYKDIERELGIKTASIHYHFPTKQILIEEVVKRYVNNFNRLMIEIEDKNKEVLPRLYQLGELFASSLADGRFCLCGMLLSDFHSISENTSNGLKAFFSSTQSWIKKQVQQGIDRGEIKHSVRPNNVAIHYLASLEGGALIARLQGYEYLMAVIDEVLSDIRS